MMLKDGSESSISTIFGTNLMQPADILIALSARSKGRVMGKVHTPAHVARAAGAAEVYYPLGDSVERRQQGCRCPYPRPRRHHVEHHPAT